MSLLGSTLPKQGWLGISRRPPHPAGDGSLGDLEAQHQQFAVNARRAPRLGSPPPSGRSMLEGPSTIFSHRLVFSPWRPNPSTVENQREAGQPQFQE